MAYVSLYRKYRSQNFGDLVGQDHVVKTLQNALTSGRLAQSYLFTGPRGTGKTSSARLLAKALNCDKGISGEPCNECDSCRSITVGNCADVIEMDAASESGADQVRSIIVEGSEYLPMYCRYKVFIIDEVHDLSAKAFDALLKTIEEPPAHAIFILATTEFNKVPPTIRSRCQKYEFHRASMSDLIQRLEYVANLEDVKFEPSALQAIARMADGGFRDALTLFEQAMLTSGGLITLNHVYDQLGLVSEQLVDELLIALSRKNISEIVRIQDEINRLGRDPRTQLESVLFRLSDLTRAIYHVEGKNATDSAREASLHALGVEIGPEKLLRFRGMLADAHKVIREISLPRIWLEAELIRISHYDQIASPPAPAYADKVQSSSVSVLAPKAAVQASDANPAEPEKKEPAHVPAGASKEVRAWAEALAMLPPTAPISKKLVGSEVLGLVENTLLVKLSRGIYIEWFSEDARRLGFILKFLREKAGADWDIKFEVGLETPT